MSLRVFVHHSRVGWGGVVEGGSGSTCALLATARMMSLVVGGGSGGSTSTGAIMRRLPNAGCPSSSSWSCSTATSVLTCAKRYVIVPKQLKAYGDAFSPSSGDRSDHLAGHLVLQKATTLKRTRNVKTTAIADNFKDMLLPATVLAAIHAMGITTPSPVQQLSIDTLCLQRKDALLAAPHGEGKTVAFVAPLYANMVKDRDTYKIPLRERRPRMILMAPTRELIDQLHAVCKQFDATTGLRSESFTSRKRAAYHLNRMLKTTKADVLIMHPRVVLKLIRARRIFLDDIRYVAVDEADIVCSSQHDHDALQLIAKIQQRAMYKHLWPVRTQFVFSTAFITRKLEYFLAQKFPKLVGCFRPKAMHLPAPTVRQRFYAVRQESEKMDVLLHLLRKHGHRPSAALTDEDELRRATTFQPLRGSRRGGATPPDDGEEGGAVVSVEDDASDLDSSHELEAAADTNGGNGGRHLQQHDATAAAVAVGAASTASASAALRRRVVEERIRPTAWDHLTTIAAPFTCPIPRTVFPDDSAGAAAVGSDGAADAHRSAVAGKRVVIFLRDIDACTAIYHRCKASGVSCALLHAALPYHVRKEMFRRFASGECNVLCATDVFSRGLDMHVDVVVNFHMPTTTVGYLARLGRVGRMGRQGDVLSLYTKQQGVIVGAIRSFNKGNIPLEQISNWQPHMKLPRFQEWRTNKINAISRSYVSMITKKTIPAHLEKTYLRHNATWRPPYHPNTIQSHGGIAPAQQQRAMDRVTADAVSFRREQLSKRKGGRAKFGSRRSGVWNDISGVNSSRVANADQSDSPGGDNFGVPGGPPR